MKWDLASVTDPSYICPRDWKILSHASLPASLSCPLALLSPPLPTPSPGRHRSAPAQPPSWSRWLPPSPSCTPLLTASRETLLKCKSDQTASRLNTLQGLPLYLKSNPTSYPASWLWLPSLTSPGPSTFHIRCSSHSGLLACFLPTVPGAVQPAGLWTWSFLCLAHP